jgi:hypothetical protein
MSHLMITADGGGSNGSRLRLWKWSLQQLADETGLTIQVCHCPPGTSKWNKIEHRMFCFITQNWRAMALVSLYVAIALTAASVARLLVFKKLLGIFFWLTRIRAIVHDRSSAIGAAFVTARLEISRFAPTRAVRLRSTAGSLPSGSLRPPGRYAPYAERVAHSWSGTARSAAQSPSRKLAPSRTRHFRLDRRRVAEGRPARLSANAAQKWRENFCLQTPETSQNCEIFWRRRGHEEASRWKSAMTEGASPKVVPHGSRPTRRRNGGKIFLPANP